jgi:molybdenum cofactor cytidylyltransferase
VIAAIVLAAGRSSRFGTQKLLAMVAGKPLVRWTVERVLASGVDRTFVVVPEANRSIHEVLSELPVEFVANRAPEDGMSGSLRAGVLALPGDTAAALIALGDQPAIPDAAIAGLVSKHRESGAPIVAPSYDGVRGHPVLFDASLFRELAAVQGDAGARDIIERWKDLVALVPIHASVPTDVDVPGDVRRVEEELKRRA